MRMHTEILLKQGLLWSFNNYLYMFCISLSHTHTHTPLSLSLPCIHSSSRSKPLPPSFLQATTWLSRIDGLRASPSCMRLPTMFPTSQVIFNAIFVKISRIKGGPPGYILVSIWQLNYL